MDPLLRQLSRIDDRETALAIGHLWRLVEFFGREVRASVEFADDAIATLLKADPPPLRPGFDRQKWRRREPGEPIAAALFPLAHRAVRRR